MQAFLSWSDEPTLTEVTKPRYGSVHPWPLNSVLCWQKRRQVLKKLAAVGWGNKTKDNVRIY